MKFQKIINLYLKKKGSRNIILLVYLLLSVYLLFITASNVPPLGLCTWQTTMWRNAEVEQPLIKGTADNRITGRRWV